MPLYNFGSFGFSGAGFTSFDFTGANTDNEVSSRPASPPFSGRILTLRAYFAGDGVSVTARCVAWRTSDGAVVARSPQFSAPSGSHASGGQALNSQAADGSGLVLESGQQAWLGFWRAPAASQVWSVLGSGTFEFLTDLSGDAGNFAGNAACGGAFTCGDLQAYCDLVGGDARAMSRGWPAYLRGRRRCR